MPTAIILAGPNGAGKTTFGSATFRQAPESFVFINADEIAQDLGNALSGRAKDLRAGRLMLQRLDEAVGAGRNLIVETTLATTIYVKRIGQWRAAGYRVVLVYVRLPGMEASLQRVRQRASVGGHTIPEADILRRFDRSRILLETVYKSLVDEWLIVDGYDGMFTTVEQSSS